MSDDTRGMPPPPAAYEAFASTFPKLEEAWGSIRDAGNEGPLNAETVRLVKLGIAIGAMRRGAVRAGVRKARAMGIDDGALQQVIALSAGTLGMPSVVAIHSWVKELLAEES